MGIRHVPMCHKRAPASSGLADRQDRDTNINDYGEPRESDSGLFSN